MKLTEINNEYTDKNTRHSYLPLYDNLLFPIKNTALSVLEIGIGDFREKNGGSLLLWLKYFTKAKIYGIDILPKTRVLDSLINNENIILYNETNAYDNKFVKDNFIEQNIKFDFILDDGPHTLESQQDFIKLYLPLLKENGILIIEDIQHIEYLDDLKNITPEYLHKYIKVYDRRHIKSRIDDIVFTIDRINSNKNIIGILPCAGKATRLHSLPKFMLPLRDNSGCLLTTWIYGLLDICNKIIIGVSQNTQLFIENIINTNFKDDNLKNKIFIKFVGNTETMNKTIIMSLKDEIFDLIIMGMPDTYFDKLSNNFFNNSSLIKNLLNDSSNINIGTYLWKIRDTQLGKIGQCTVNNTNIVDIVDKDPECNYEYGWGSIVFKHEFIKYIDVKDQHVGYSMKKYLENNNIIYEKIHGMFYDCGTIGGYKEYLNSVNTTTLNPIYIKGTLIIIAVYINNTNKSYVSLLKSLVQVRDVYKHEFIIAVDNESLNTSWYDTARKLNIIILNNKSKLHRYEIGAYKLALQYYRADKYIFIQGTIIIKQKIDLSCLNIQKINALAFSIINNDLCWSQDGLNLINNLLSTLGMKEWNNNPMILWNSFCCNNYFILDMLEDGIFDLPSNTKNHSCAFERILGCYFNLKLKSILTIGKNNCDMNNDIYQKIPLYQTKITL